MAATIQINERGSMTLPKKLRRRLGLETGGVVMAETAEGGVLLRPAVAYPIEIYSDGRGTDSPRVGCRAAVNGWES